MQLAECIGKDCDTNHVLNSDYSGIVVVGAGADAVDFKLISLLHKGERDIVVTQGMILLTKEYMDAKIATS